MSTEPRGAKATDAAPVLGRIQPVASLPGAKRHQTGIPWFDDLTGGFPVGGTVEIYGMDQLFKTTTALDIAGSFTGLGDVLYWATEPLDREHAEARQIDMDKVMRLRAVDIEQAHATIMDYIRDHRVSLIVIDSIAAARARHDRNAASLKRGMHPKTVNTFLLEMAPELESRGISLLIINQERSIPQHDGSAQSAAPGGSARLFLDKVRLLFTLECEIVDPENQQPVGRLVKVILEKLKGLRGGSSTAQFVCRYNGSPKDDLKLAEDMVAWELAAAAEAEGTQADLYAEVDETLAGVR